MNSVDVVKKAIEFDDPDYIPIELVEVPGVYDDYGTIPREMVDESFPPLKDFDAIQAIFPWVCEEMGRDENGDRLTTVFAPTDTFYLLVEASGPEDTRIKATWTAVNAAGVEAKEPIKNGEVAELRDL